MLSEDITTDQIMADIDQQLELLEMMADKNLILSDIKRVFLEARALITSQNLQLLRLEDLIDSESLSEIPTLIESVIDNSNLVANDDQF